MNDNRQAYYERARTWAVDEQTSLRQTLQWTRICASAAVLIAILEAFALLLLTPLKTVKPIPILVDRQTGFVEVLDSDGSMRLKPDASLIRSFLAQYVTARESFNIGSIQSDYKKVALWSEGSVRNDYMAYMAASSQNSPLKRYARSTLVDTHVKSISLLGPKTALVRFETVRRDQAGQQTAPEAWAAVIGYRFSDAPLSAEDRIVNPLGFEVTQYRKDSEIADNSAEASKR